MAAALIRYVANA